jgi:hypothetical protein
MDLENVNAKARLLRKAKAGQGRQERAELWRNRDRRSATSFASQNSAPVASIAAPLPISRNLEPQLPLCAMRTHPPPVPARDRIKTSKPGSVCSHRSHALLTTNIHPSLLDAPSICPHSTDLLVAPLCRAPAHPQRHILVLLGRELLRNCTCPSARIGEKGA